MSGELHVDTGALRAHASRVAGLSDKAAAATAAAEQVSFSPTMYGVIGSMLVAPMMHPLEAAGVASSKAIEGALAGTSESVKATADTFTFIDETVGRHFEGIGSRIR